MRHRAPPRHRPRVRPPHRWASPASGRWCLDAEGALPSRNFGPVGGAVRAAVAGQAGVGAATAGRRIDVGRVVCRARGRAAVMRSRAWPRCDRCSTAAISARSPTCVRNARRQRPMSTSERAPDDPPSAPRSTHSARAMGRGDGVDARRQMAPRSPTDRTGTQRRVAPSRWRRCIHNDKDADTRQDATAGRRRCTERHRGIAAHRLHVFGAPCTAFSGRRGHGQLPRPAHGSDTDHLIDRRRPGHLALYALREPVWCDGFHCAGPCCAGHRGLPAAWTGGGTDGGVRASVDNSVRLWSSAICVPSAWCTRLACVARGRSDLISARAAASGRVGPPSGIRASGPRNGRRASLLSSPHLARATR